jgi:MFS family permease
MISFLRDNLRWLGAGLLLTFASSFGQTWFIALFAGEIKNVYGLTDGGWGTLYTAATLAAAGLLFARGALADTMELGRLAPGVALLFAAAGLGVALGNSLWLLGLSIFLLRFCGQGMFTHIAMTAMGRWFHARRGRAVSIAGLGYPMGEVLLPFPAVLLMALAGWQATWGVVAAVLALGVAPLLLFLLARRREPQGGVTASDGVPGLAGRHWTRSDALRHWLFPTLIPVLLTPGFVGTTVFFHQVHIAGVKGWTLAQMAPGYPVYATMSIIAALTSGWAADRLGPTRLLPFLLAPMGIGVILIGPAETVSGWFVALGFIGLTQGMSSSLWGAFFPAIYGANHLGAVRSLATTLMVIASAIGPGVTGLLIDYGVDFPRQCLAMGLWCLALSLGCLAISNKLALEEVRP